MGRTQLLWFVNFYAEYNFKLFDRYTLQFNLNIDNMFNIATARRTYSRLTSANVVVTQEELLAGDWELTADRYVEEPRFGQLLEFYPPISARIGVKFIF